MTIVVEALRKARVLSSLGQLRRLAGYNMQPALLRLPQQIPSRQLRSNAETTEQDNDDILNIDPVLGRWKPPISPEDDVAQDEDMDDEEIYHPSAMLAKKLLLDKGYVAYHHNPGLPPWVKAHMTTISKNRTTPQLRRCLQKWMVARHSYDTLKKFSHRPLGWYDNVPSSEDKFANAIVFGPEETAAYTHFFLPSRFAITKRVMNEVKKLLPSFSPVNVLDFGCGPATAAAAISTVWPDTMKHYAGLDRSQSMLDAAAIMTKGLCDTVFWSRTVDAVRQGKRYDMVVMTYTLADLPHDPAKKAATQLAFEFLNEGGILVCIEEGNPIGSHIVRTARQFLLDTFNNVERSGSYKHIAPVEPETPDRVAKPAESTKLTTGHMMLPSPSSRPYNELGATVIAPCTHDRPCPLASGVWCSFSQKVTGPIIRKDSEEKFSYVAMRKIVKNEVGANLSEQWLQSVPASPPATPRANPKAMSPRELLLWFSQQDNRGHLQELMASLEDIEWDDYEPIIRRSEWGRIVRSPLKGKGHLTIDMCTPEGRIMRHTHSRSTLKHVTGIYIAARKLNWGGLIPFYMSGQLSAFADKTQRRIQKPRFVDNDDEDDEDDDEDFKQPRRRGAGRGVMAAEDEGWAVESPRMRGTGNTTFFEADHEEVEKLHKRGGGGRKSKSVTAEHRQRDVSAAQEEGASEQRIGRRRRAVPPRRRPSEDGGAGDE